MASSAVNFYITKDVNIGLTADSFEATHDTSKN